MAKRAPVGEEPYRPLLDAGAIAAALTRTPQAPPVALSQASPAKVIDIGVGESPAHDSRSTVQEAQVPRPFGTEKSGRPAPVLQSVEKLDQEKRMLLTRSESMALERVVSSLASRVNAQVKLSHVLRSFVTLLLHAEKEVDRRAGEVVGITRPANGDFKALQKFEREIANIIAAGFRDSPPLREP